MESSPGVFVVMKKLALITVIGFAAIILSGPALALAGTLLPFFLVGLVIYVAYQAITVGPRVAFAMVGGLFRGIGAVVIGVPVAFGRFLGVIVPKSIKGFLGLVFAIPLWILGKVAVVVRWVFGAITGLIGFGFSVALDAFAGASIGAMLGVVGGLQHNDLELRIPAGALLGLAIGALAGATRSRPARARPAPVALVAKSPEQTPVLELAK